MGVIEERRRIIAAQPHLVTASGSSVLVTIAEPKIERLRVTFAPVQTGSGTPSPSNVRPIMGWATIAASIGTMPVDISLGGTYYGGTVDLVSGVMTVTHGCYAFTGEEAGWYTYDPGGTNCRHSLKAESYVPVPFMRSNQYGIGISSHFTIGRTFISMPYGNMIFTDYFQFNDPSGSHWGTSANFKSWLAAQKTAGTPVQIYGQLATPQTVTLTPQTILALRGQQTVTSPAGAVEISYWTH